MAGLMIGKMAQQCVLATFTLPVGCTNPVLAILHGNDGRTNPETPENGSSEDAETGRQ